MLFGTFDLFHKGHEHLFRQARALAENPYLIVSVARDANVKRIKGRAPLYGERRRLKVIKNHPLADKAVLGGLRDHIPHIVKLRPDIIALGYDQRDYVYGLKKQLAGKGLRVAIRRLKPHRPERYKSSLLKTLLAKRRIVI